MVICFNILFKHLFSKTDQKQLTILFNIYIIYIFFFFENTTYYTHNIVYTNTVYYTQNTMYFVVYTEALESYT